MFASTKGTPYYRLQRRRAKFDAVVTLSVKGVSISATARIEAIAGNTAACWLEKATDVCGRFNRGRIVGFGAEELQADEMRSPIGRIKGLPPDITCDIRHWGTLPKLPCHYVKCDI